MAMTFSGSVWNSLKFSAGKSGIDALSSLGWSYSQSPERQITFKNNRAYKIMLAHVAKQTAMQMIEAEINKLFPKYRKHIENTLRDVVLEQQDKNYATLIRNQEKQVDDNEWGSITTSTGQKIFAKDKYGNRVPEALLLAYDGDNDITIEDVNYTQVDGRMVGTKVSITSKTLCFIDLAPKVSISSAKNIVMTTVQGRDYTRKELVSGGDVKFSVSGTIVGDEMGVYPDSQVKKLIQICQYGGVIKVKHHQFSQFNVNQVIITDYSLGEQEYKNEQPYSFSCVAVEPDEDVAVTKDTIAVLNEELRLSPMNKWYKLILDNKLVELAANAATNMASSIANAGLDVLTPGI